MLILVLLAALAVGYLALFGGMFVTPEWE